MKLRLSSKTVLKTVVFFLLMSISSFSFAKAYYLVTISGSGPQRGSDGIIDQESVFDSFDLVKDGHKNLVDAQRRFVYNDSEEEFQSLFDDMKDFEEQSGEQVGLILIGHSMGVKFAFERFIDMYGESFERDPDLVIAIEGGHLDYGFWFRSFRGELNTENCHNYYQTMPLSLVQGSPLQSCSNQNLTKEVFDSMSLTRKSFYYLSPAITGALSSGYSHKTVALIAWEKSHARIMELLED